MEDLLTQAINPLSMPVLLGLIVLCIVILCKGADWMIDGVVELARMTGIPRIVVGATIVSIGTTLPELMTGISAVRKGHPDVMVGNVMGANVLNCLFVIGAAATASSLTVPPVFYSLHFVIMLFILYSVRIFIAMNQDGYFKQWQGAWFVVIYLGYVVTQYSMQPG